MKISESWIRTAAIVVIAAVLVIALFAGWNV